MGEDVSINHVRSTAITSAQAGIFGANKLGAMFSHI